MLWRCSERQQSRWKPVRRTEPISPIQRIRDWPVGQSRRLFGQIILFYSIPANTKTIAPLDDCNSQENRTPNMSGYATCVCADSHRLRLTSGGR